MGNKVSVASRARTILRERERRAQAAVGARALYTVFCARQAVGLPREQRAPRSLLRGKWSECESRMPSRRGIRDERGARRVDGGIVCWSDAMLQQTVKACTCGRVALLSCHVLTLGTVAISAQALLLKASRGCLLAMAGTSRCLSMAPAPTLLASVVSVRREGPRSEPVLGVSGSASGDTLRLAWKRHPVVPIGKTAGSTEFGFELRLAGAWMVLRSSP